MGRLLNSTGFWAFTLACLVCGIGLLLLSLWLQPLVEGQRASAEGAPQAALDDFDAGETRFAHLPVMRQLLPGVYTAVRTNQFRTLYRLGMLDVLLEKTTDAVDVPSARFWAGCVLFQRAMQEAEPGARRAWLARARDEFRRALELAPGDWDTKFNYELTAGLLARFQQAPEPPPNRLLRPKPREGERPSRPLG